MTEPVPPARPDGPMAGPVAGPVADQGQGPDAGLPEGAVHVRMRRAVRYRPFVLTGAVLLGLVGVVVSVVRGASDGQFTERSLAGYVGAIGLLVGGVLGGAVAVLLDRRRHG